MIGAVPVASIADGVEKGALILCAALAAGALVLPGARMRAAAMLAALLGTPVLLAGHRWHTSTLSPLRHHPAAAVAAGVGGLVVVALAARWLYARPRSLPLLAVAALPFRVPVSLGGTTSNLLIPLYVVIGVGAVAWALPTLLGRPGPAFSGSSEVMVGAAERPAPGLGAAFGPDRRARLLAGLLAAAVVLYAVQAAYSAQFGKALGQVVFFYVPFALLAALLVGVPFDETLLRRAVAVLTVIAVVCVVVGVVELVGHHLLLNAKLRSADEFGAVYRVNSLFYDPNIYGRFLSVVAVLLASALLWAPDARALARAGAGLAVVFLGMLSTLSQSSFVALLVGLAVLAGLRFGARRVVGVGAGALVLGVLFLVILGSAVHVDLGRARALDTASSGRTGLISGGADLFAQRPLGGWGSASFAAQFTQHEASRVEDPTQTGGTDTAVAASHTIPITVGAEQGLIGLLVYLGLLLAAFALLLGAGAGAGAKQGHGAARAAVAAAFAALVAHTLLYADFLEDPTTWALLAVGGALAAAPGAAWAAKTREGSGQAGAAAHPAPASA